MVSTSIPQRSVARTAVIFVAAVLLSSLPLTTSPIRAQAPATAAGGGSYWICRAIPGDGTSYYSDIFAAPDSAYTDMAKAFTQFLAAKYNQKNGVPTCIHYVSNQQAQTYMKQFAAGTKSILTGWKYGQTAAPSAPAPSPAPSLPPASPVPPAATPAPGPAAQAPPASATITMRMVDLVNSATDPPGKRYRAVVTQAATAGSVSIPVNTDAKITLAQSGGTWSAQLNSLSLNGQMVPVTSSSVSATSPIQQEAQKLKSLIRGFGGPGKNVSSSAAVATAIATGDHVFLPVGALLTFTASVPQPSTQASAASTAPPSTSSASPADIGAASAPAPASSAAPASNAAAVPAPGQPLPQTGEGKQAFCFAAAEKNQYVSATFDAKYVNPGDEAPWVRAFSNYVATHFNPKLAGVRCMVYRSAAAAQAALKNRKTLASQPGGLPVTETGWVYMGPEPGPPASAPNPAKPSK